MTTKMNFPTSPFYEELTGKVDENILRLRDSRGVFLLDKLNQTPIKYFRNQCLDTPWQNQLLLAETEIWMHKQYVTLSVI
ncbi:hypothetical protein [Bacillus cereus]|uniref:hypothetical protein n=1 Tax=Bacillus cereus TaxID=1396 RepID=UPI00211DA1CC|nr:hypothetical protein [Bacillus cereus]